MAVVRAREQDVRLLARLMRAEAEGDGELGMLMVGNVGVNRVLSNCLDFIGLHTIEDMVFQVPGGFEAIEFGYFYQNPREQDMRLAQRIINGETVHPATNALWFFRPEGDCPPTWYGQWNVGRFRAHCFFVPTPEDCPLVYGF